MSRFNYALILMGEKKYTQASAAMRKCIDYGKTHGISPEYLCSAYKRMYSNYLKMEQRDSAQIYMRLCFDTSTRNGLNHKFAQVINDTFKKNFSNYVNEYRIRLACIRLSDTANWGNYTLKGIGESVGFRSYTTFVTVFRKITGLTPRLYQEKASKESLAEA